MDAMIFDWDGTLVDSLPVITRINVEVLGVYGVAYDEAAYRAALRPDWRSMYLQLGVPAALVEEVGRLWIERYRAQMSDVQAFPDVHLALERLASAGHPIGIVTAGDRLVVEYQLHATGLDAYVEVLVCGDDLPFSKPHPAPLQKALDWLGVGDRPTDATYVGDAPDDMRMARTVGARGIGIVSMLAVRAELHDAGAVEVADSVTAWVASHFTRSEARAASGGA
ncbi:MAG: HAD-IA family hydrolase [Chloroflexota bacterium]